MSWVFWVDAIQSHEFLKSGNSSWLWWEGNGSPGQIRCPIAGSEVQGLVHGELNSSDSSEGGSSLPLEPAERKSAPPVL